MKRHIAYPKTPYLPWSPGIDPKDPIANLADFVGKKIAISVKMDGSNIAMTREGIYGRSEQHPSLTEIKAKHGGISYLIPENGCVFGESLVAKHSIHYTGPLALKDTYQVFAYYNEDDDAFSDVKYTQTMVDQLGLTMVSYIIVEPHSLERFEHLVKITFDVTVAKGNEGIVVRNVESFRYEDFSHNVAKMVRPNHVQSTTHWSNEPFIKNDRENKRTPKTNQSIRT